MGQETTGAGGLAKALRTVPVVAGIAERVRAVSPAAWIVNFTNPVGIVTRSLLEDGHRAVGLCNVAIGLQRYLAGLLDAVPEQVELTHVGLNHLSWELDVPARRRRTAHRAPSGRTCSSGTGSRSPSTSSCPRRCCAGCGSCPRTTCATSTSTTLS